ncbi:MAG: hypothetical protein AB7G48_20650 [Nitrospiraceae bacterium]
MKSRGLAVGVLYLLFLLMIFYPVPSLLPRIPLLELNARRVRTFGSNRLTLRDRLLQTWDR